MDSEAARIAAEVEHAAAARRGDQFAPALAVVALVAEEPGLVLATDLHEELGVVLSDRYWLAAMRRTAGRAIKAFLLLRIVVAKGKNLCIGELRQQRVEHPMLQAPHARRVEANHQHIAKAVHDQAREPVTLGVDHAIAVSHRIKPVDVTPQVHRIRHLLGQPVRINHFIRLFAQQADRHRRLHVEHAAPDELAINAMHLHQTARHNALTGPLHHLLEDQRMHIFALALEADNRQRRAAMAAPATLAGNIIHGWNDRGCGAVAH